MWHDKYWGKVDAGDGWYGKTVWPVSELQVRKPFFVIQKTISDYLHDCCVPHHPLRCLARWNERMPDLKCLSVIFINYCLYLCII